MMKTKNSIVDNLITKYPQLSKCKKEILAAIDLIVIQYKNNGKLLCCGNGGSAADCEHICGELMKGFVLARKIKADLVEKICDPDISCSLQYGLPCIPLTSHMALMTAILNDNSGNSIFSQQVLSLGRKEDTLLCISTSGNSLDCYYAAKVAKALGLTVISLTGEKESKLSSISDVTIKVPSTITYEIQELHLPVYHAMCIAIENEFYGE